MNPDASNQNAPVIEMHDVMVTSLQDPDQIVLENVNWTVNAGEYWVIGAMHGSGKSNLMSLAGGIMPPQSGTYKLFGHEMPMFDPKMLKERLRLGLVFETGQLLHQLTVKENISLPLHYHQSDLPWQQQEERVKAMLELMELSPLSKQMAGSIGRNWQKRVGLARALMLEPEVLLIDQPLTGLDLRHANWWLTFIKRLVTDEKFFPGRKITVVVTAEDLRPWRDQDCHFAILKDKQFITLGHRPQFAGHREPLVHELMAETVPTPD